MFAATLQVAIGGALGAACRFLLGTAILRVWGGAFPVAVMTANILGSFLMGLFLVWSYQRGHEGWNLFVMTGVLGGFTTFSAFSVEAFTLFERGQPGLAAVYVGASVILSILGLAAGVFLARGLWA